MSVLERVSGPEDLAGLSRAELGRLAEEIREFLVTHVSATGGHLGPNLGVVELTLAVHRVFDSPKDSVVFDTGHQSYVHKLLTGQQAVTVAEQRYLRKDRSQLWVNVTVSLRGSGDGPRLLAIMAVMNRLSPSGLRRRTRLATTLRPGNSELVSSAE